MRILFILLFVAGLFDIVEPFLYLCGKQWYEKNSEADPNYKFEELKLRFEGKEWKIWFYLAMGIILILAAILIYIKFGRL